LSDETRPGGSFGDRLRHDRLAAGLSQEELAERAGLSVRAISNLEHGRVQRPRRDTAQRLARALLTARQDQPKAAEGRPSPPVAQLPADLADFTGRQREVSLLTRLLTSGRAADPPGAVVTAAVTGAGGIGKTAVAIHAGHQVTTYFPDGQLYLDLRGSSTQPVLPAAALSRLLRDLGTEPAAVPVDEAERAARYRSIADGKRLLVVLDDARDAAQVRPLLPGASGCAVLVTSRHSLAGLESAHPLHLDVMERADASALFTSIAGPVRAASEAGAVRQVLATCAGLPLAIRIAAARLASRPAWSVRVLADRLDRAQRPLDELQAGDLAVRTCFSASYESLRQDGDGQAASRFFRLLGLAEGPDISLPAAAALAGTSTELAEAALELLVDASMLQSPASGRYRFHDLLRAYARERARDEEPAGDRRAAIRRMLLWYLHTTAAAARIISPARPHPSLDDEAGLAPLSFADYGAALAWLDAEHVNLVAAVSQAAADAEHEIARYLPLELWDLFVLRSHLDAWIETHGIGVASARAVGDLDAEHRLLNNLGGAYFAAGRLEDAAENLRQTIDLCSRLGKPYAVTSMNLGLTLTKLGRTEEAAVLLADARDQFHRAGNSGAEHAALICLGAALRRGGQPAQALAVLREALETATDESLAYYESDALVEMTEARLSLGESEAAINDGIAAVELARRLGYRENEAQALDALGRAQLASGRPAQARSVWREAMTIFTELGKTDESSAVAARLKPTGVHRRQSEHAGDERTNLIGFRETRSRASH
jgi:transcriptional regulator with XRE-family HTH domain/tetratricopeptide (TPR) repeat protein